jgi:hypothetical protein
MKRIGPPGQLAIVPSKSRSLVQVFVAFGYRNIASVRDIADGAFELDGRVVDIEVVVESGADLRHDVFAL